MAEAQIYDTLFFRIFSKPQRAGELVRNVVPKAVLSRINPEGIHIDERSFVDKKLRRHFSDVLIRFELTVREGGFAEGPPHGSRREHPSADPPSGRRWEARGNYTDGRRFGIL